MKALAVVLALSLAAPAFGQAADAPVALKKGDVAPVDGLLLPDAAAIAAAKRLAAAEAERDELRKAPVVAPWAVVLIGVLAAGVGVGVTVGIYEGLKAKQ